MSSEAGGKPPEHRLHWSSLIVGLAGAFRHIAILLVISILAARNRGGGEGFIYPAVILVLSILGVVLQYFTFRYRYDATELVIKSGLIRRNERHIPYDRIQNIDATANILEQMLGVVSVQVQTGGGGKPEGVFRTLPQPALEEMRERVFGQAGIASRANMGTAAGAPVAGLSSVAVGAGRGFTPGSMAAATPPMPVQSRVLLRLSPTDLLLAGLMESKAFAVLLPILSIYILAAQAGMHGALLARASAWSTAVGVATVVATVVAGLIALRLFATLFELIRLYGFTLTRIGEDLRVEYGLLTKVAATIPLRRVQTVTVRQTIMHRLFDRAQIHVSSAGGGMGQTGKQHREEVAPIIRPEDAAEILEQLQPGVQLDQVAWRKPHAHAFHRLVSRWSLVFGAIALASAPFIHWWALAAYAPVFVLGVIRAYLISRQLAWGTLADGVVYRLGALTHKTIATRYARVQAVELEESPIDRWTTMAAVSVDTAGTGSAGMRMPFLARADAAELRELVSGKSAGTAFVW